MSVIRTPRLREVKCCAQGHGFSGYAEPHMLISRSYHGHALAQKRMITCLSLQAENGNSSVLVFFSVGVSCIFIYIHTNALNVICF